MRRRRFSVAAASRPLLLGRRDESQERTPAATALRPEPQALLLQGKHVGRTFEYVAREDRSYVEWAVRESVGGSLSRNLASFVQYVKIAYGGLLTMGKHRGRYFVEIVQNDPQYAHWCGSASCPSDFSNLKEFAAYALEGRATGGCSSKRGEESLTKKCTICLERPLGAAWIPCGHTVACYECAIALDRRCPICRRAGHVQKLFVG